MGGILAFLLALAQEPAPDPLVRLVTGEEFRARLEGISAEAELRWVEGERLRSIPIEDVVRIVWRTEHEGRPAGAAIVRLRRGEILSGSVESYDGSVLKIKAPHGDYSVAGEELRSIHFRPFTWTTVPETPSDPSWLALTPEDASSEPGIISGELRTLGSDRIEFGREVYPRDRVSAIFFTPIEVQPTPTGWFARLQFMNGDRLVGSIRAVDKSTLEILTPGLGAVRVESRHLRAVSFVPAARVSVVRIVVCDGSGIHEMDSEGKRAWSYPLRGPEWLAAYALDNGNVLMVSHGANEVLEVRPRGRSGGEAVWRIQTRTPLDAQRLPNGNTLVAERGSNRIVEYGAGDRTVAWQAAVTNPVTCRRLESGRFFVGKAQGGVVEIDDRGKQVWQLSTGLPQYPGRAVPLDNGHILATDIQNGKVIELDRTGRLIWSLGGFGRPLAAVRLEDGNTLIAEQMRGRVVEVDPTGRQIREYGGFSAPTNVSAY